MPSPCFACSTRLPTAMSTVGPSCALEPSAAGAAARSHAGCTGEGLAMMACSANHLWLALGFGLGLGSGLGFGQGSRVRVRVRGAGSGFEVQG